jgi:hypothetical protein
MVRSGCEELPFVTTIIFVIVEGIYPIVVGSKFCKNPLNDSLDGTNNELTT